MSEPSPGGTPPNDPAQAPAARPAPQYPAAQYPVSQYPGGYQQPADPQQYYGSAMHDPHRRPGTVVAAAIVTWICAAVALLGAGLMFVAAAVLSDDAFFSDLTDATDESISRDDARIALVAIGLVVVVWAVAAAALALLAFRRKNWARITLVVSAAVSMVVDLLAITAIVPGLLLLAAIAVVVLLFTGGANDWYRGGRPAAPSYPPTVY